MKVRSPRDLGHRFDLVIVGAGAAGMAAAVGAAAHGARVAIVDRYPYPGGTAATAMAGTLIAGSPLQAQLGIADSPDAAFEDWIAWGGPRVDREWVRRYVNSASGEIFEWLGELGIQWLSVNKPEGNRVPRWHVPKGGGKAIMTVLERTARRSHHITWLLGNEVSGLITSAGAVTGVEIAGSDHVLGDSVLLATGGFANNPEMVAQVAAPDSRAPRTLMGGGQGATGTGHRMLGELGAAFGNLDAVWSYPYGTPDYRDQTGRRGLAIRNLDGDIWVNRYGRRFHDETKRGGATGTPALLRQPDATSWSIFDSRIASQLTIADPFYRDGTMIRRDRIRDFLDRSPFAHQANTVTDLASSLGMDADVLRETVDEYNGWIVRGVVADPAHGRSISQSVPLTEPPFHALQFFPLARKNLGGVLTDWYCRVLRTDGRPIENLFAAGEVAGMAGGRLNGDAALEGTMAGPSMWSGRLAAEAALS